jgi:hypothetical protein
MRRIALAAAVLSGPLATGCMTVGPVAGPVMNATGFTYTAGRATQDFPYPPTALQSAISGGMDDLRIHSVHLMNDGGILVYQGSTADNRRVSVTIRPNQAVSRLSIRIGWFGDEPLSRALMDRIAIRLGELPPKAIPVDPPSEPASNPYFSRDAVPDSVMLRDQADAIYRDSPVP